MISLGEAQDRLLRQLPEVATESLPLAQTLGRWLTCELRAIRTQPARDLSAMDGYAVASDVETDVWDVVGESAAGAPFTATVRQGQAVRIFTGAAVPSGADCVIIQEDVDRSGTRIRMKDGSTIKQGQHIRVRGSDFAGDQILLPAGSAIDARALALAAMAGHDKLMVRRRLRLAIISTGDELVMPGHPCDDDHIPASNAVMITGMLSGYPVDIIDLGIVPDRADALSEAIRQSRDCDFIVTIGGASVGDHDLVRPTLLQEGATLDFWKVAMRPGKPLMAGRLGDAVVMGLPGNPVSAFVTATLFLLPAIAAMAGAAHPLPRRVMARLGEAMPAVGGRTDHIRAKLSESGVIAIGLNDSAALNGLARADALIVRDAGSPAAIAGDMVQIILLS